MGKSKKSKKEEKKPKKESTESSSEEETKKGKAASSSDDSSSDEAKTAKPAAKKAEKKKESSDDSSSEEETKDTPAEAEDSGKKRKAEDSGSAPKKTKSEGSGSETYSIWVGNLSYDATEDDLKEFFNDCGEIKNARIISRDGRSKGFGYVDFGSLDSRKSALDKNESEFMGRNLMIKEAESKPDRPEGGAGRGRGGPGAGEEKEPSNSLFVGNLSWDVTEDTLREAFGAHGEVTSVRIATDKMSGKPRGFAHVEFGDVETAKTAKGAMDGTEIMGRGIRLDYASQKQGFGGRGGDRGGFGGDRGGFGGRGGRGGRGRGGFGGRGGDRGGRGGRGGFGGRGGRGGDRERPSFSGKRTTFDE